MMRGSGDTWELKANYGKMMEVTKIEGSRVMELLKRYRNDLDKALDEYYERPTRLKREVNYTEQEVNYMEQGVNYMEQGVNCMEQGVNNMEQEDDLCDDMEVDDEHTQPTSRYKHENHKVVDYMDPPNHIESIWLEAEFNSILASIKEDGRLARIYDDALQFYRDQPRDEIVQRSTKISKGNLLSVDYCSKNYEIVDGTQFFGSSRLVLAAMNNVLPEAQLELGHEIAKQVVLHQKQLIPMTRGKAHNDATGQIFQFGYNSGQPGRKQVGLCSNSRLYPDLHRLVERFAKGSWALLMALNDQHCREMLLRIRRTGAPCLQGCLVPRVHHPPSPLQHTHTHTPHHFLTSILKELDFKLLASLLTTRTRHILTRVIVGLLFFAYLEHQRQKSMLLFLNWERLFLLPMAKLFTFLAKSSCTLQPTLRAEKDGMDLAVECVVSGLVRKVLLV